MDRTWLPTLFQTCPGGASSAVAPELLPPGQYAWCFNVAVRGAKPHSRPPFIERAVGLPRGLMQGASYFGVQDGMIVVAIAGRLYRIRIGVHAYSSELIPLPWYNSGILKQAWYQQTIETLVVQDSQSNAILYNGSVARRAGPTEVPRGRSMAYGNGRLWVAVNENELLAGDIRTGAPGSELFFTEGTYLVGGGKLFFPRGISGMDFIPVQGAADFGTLIIGGKDYMESIRADVTTRAQWGMPGFITNVFRDVGFAGDWSIVQVNQDLYWRDADGGIRSLANNISTNSMPGSTPISREVGRLVDFDSNQLLPFCSAIYFGNRLLMTASPYLNVSGGVSFKNIVALDFSPISTMQGKAPPAYDGQWTGIPGITQLITGEFNGRERAFALASDEAGINRLWEIAKDGQGFGVGQGRGDVSLSCGSGAIDPVENPQPLTVWPIQSFIEYPSADFRLPTQRKRLERCDVWLSGIVGELDLIAYWRSDNNQTWTEWDRAEMAAKTEDDSTVTPHVWKNLLPQQRTQIKTFTIPDGIDEITKYALQMGFAFQIRLAWLGKCQIEKVMIYASPQDDPDYANRETLTSEFIENNVTGNSIGYAIPTCTECVTITGDVMTDGAWEPSGIYGGPFSPATATFTLSNPSEVPLEWSVTLSESWMEVDIPSGTLEPGQSIDVTVSLDADALAPTIEPRTGTISFTNNTEGNNCVSPASASEFPVSLSVESEGSMLFEGRQLGGTAALCGFPAFIASDPIRYFLTKHTVSGPFYTCTMGSLIDCDVEPSDCPGQFSFNFDGFISGIPFQVRGNGHVSFTDENLTHRTFIAIVTGEVKDHEPPDPEWTPMPCRMIWEQSAINHTINSGDSFTVPKSDGDVGIAFQFNYVSWQSMPGGTGCLNPGLQIIPVTSDFWNRYDSYTLPGCELTVGDTGHREVGVAYDCDTPFNTSSEPIPASNPVDAYGGGVAVTTNELILTYNGVGCTGTAPDLVKFAGVITVNLSGEDGDQAAIARLEAANPFGPYAPAGQIDAGYQVRTERTFGYVRGQWRALITDLIPLQEYTLTLDIYQRPYGTGSYALIGTLVIPFTATGNGDYFIDNQEVVNPIGYETYLTNPAVT